MRTIHLLTIVCFISVISSPAQAEQGCDDDALGVHRTMTIPVGIAPGVYDWRQIQSDLKDKEIILTFDDGPSPDTNDQIVNLLKAECLKATFFLVGKKAQEYPTLVKNLAAAGHTIGNHSWSHKRFTEIDDSEVQQEVSQGIRAVEEALAPDYHGSQYFRFPHLSHNPMSDLIVHSHGMAAIGTNFMVPDWTDISPQEIHDLMIEQITQRGNKGMLILHDIHPRSIKALELLMSTFKKQGYKIVHLLPENQDFLPNTD